MQVIYKDFNKMKVNLAFMSICYIPMSEFHIITYDELR